MCNLSPTVGDLEPVEQVEWVLLLLTEMLTKKVKTKNGRADTESSHRKEIEVLKKTSLQEGLSAAPLKNM